MLPYIGTLKGVTLTGGNLHHAKAIKPDLLVVYRDYRVEHPADFELLSGGGGAAAERGRHRRWLPHLKRGAGGELD